MKEGFLKVILLVIFAVIFSGLSGCSDTASSKKGPVSTYPPIPSAVAESELKGLDGTTFRVSEKKGKVVLLNMWATWCGPCRAEMPSLVRMQDTHRDQDFEVIGLNTDDESADEINVFAADMKLNYTLVWADTKLQSALLNISKFPGIPQSFLIDRDGNLRGVFKGANPADIRKMEELVGQVVRGEEGSFGETTPSQPQPAEAEILPEKEGLERPVEKPKDNLKKN